MAGRNGKLTPEVQERICEGIEKRMTHHLAAALAGICKATYYGWLKIGRDALKRAEDARSTGTEYEPTEKEQKCVEFLDAVKEAEARGQEELMRIVWAAARTEDWKAAKFILERRHPKEFAPRIHRPEQDGDSITIHFNRPALDPNAVSDGLIVGKKGGNENGSNSGDNGDA